MKTHPKYYFEDKMVVFMVENTLFKVHRHFLSKYSEAFSAMFTCKPDPNLGAEGENADRPIVLEGVTLNEITCLLDYFYDGSLPDNPTLQGKDLDSRWIDLLSIATRFTVDRARAYAIESVDRIDQAQGVNPVQKVTLAIRFEVRKWLVPAYMRICRRDASITFEEAETLGWVTTVKLLQARESDRRMNAQCGACGNKCKPCGLSGYGSYGSPSRSLELHRKMEEIANLQ